MSHTGSMQNVISLYKASGKCQTILKHSPVQFY